MTTPAPTLRRGLAFSPKTALRLAGSAAFALAMAYRNVAIAGPVDNSPVEARPIAPYAAPVIETATVGQEEPRPEAARPEARTESLIVMIDHLRRVGFDSVVRTVLVGNPAIADVKMISKREAVVVAKQVGSTNIYFLDQDGRALGDFDVVVREGEARRVVLRRGPSQTELFQCAPRCERTLTQMDSPASHGALSEIVGKENALAKDAAASGDGDATPKQ